MARINQRAKELAQRLNKPVCAWISDKQDAFITSITTKINE